mmetsp:Transcript_18821/g.46626  ORF Transcript_18821/g.46626 Transcript_18821/m.46626 type:complete len:208 (+) Transcript_18821:1854-2477(+)
MPFMLAKEICTRKSSTLTSALSACHYTVTLTLNRREGTVYIPCIFIQTPSLPTYTLRHCLFYSRLEWQGLSYSWLSSFFVYNRFVFKRNEKLVENAARSNAVITSLFPDNIRNQLIGDDSRNNPRSFQELLGPASDAVANLARPPLADYFATATVMFADICGFTAWSSVREPSQVFTLLETLYGSFDRLTKHSKVFKVETVGYVFSL